MPKIALLIGVSDYEPGLNPLPGTLLDVDALQRVLANPEMGGFAPDDVTVLKNPSRQTMEDAIYRLFSDRQRDDLLLLYFSGHGIKAENGRLYLATRETRKENGRLVNPSAVAAAYLHERIEDSRSQRQVIILDCCYSGAIALGMTVKDSGTLDLQTALGGKGRAILTSSTSVEYSFGLEAPGYDDDGLSVYTRYLVEGIETGAADTDDDGQISVEELHTYASGRVKDAAPAMTPKFYPVEEGYKIILAKSPQNDPRLKYRKEVQTKAEQSQGNLSVFALRTLDGRRLEWGVSPDDAEAILNEVLQPYRDYARKCQEYEQALIEAVNLEYPFSANTNADLIEYRRHLALRDDDSAEIEARILAPREADYQQATQHQQEEQERQRQAELKRQAEQQQQAELERQQAAERKRQSEQVQRKADQQPQAEARKQPPQQPATKTVEIETVTITGFEKTGLFGMGPPKALIRHSRHQVEVFSEDLGDDVVLDLVKIPSGEFLMGSPNSETERRDYEGPQHRVMMPGFYMGRYAVTHAQWCQVAELPKVKINLKAYPSSSTGAKQPVEQVSWEDAVEFFDRLNRFVENRLSAKIGTIYRLPSEAEWEYACRADTTTPFHFGETVTTNLANHNGNYTYGDGPKGKYRQRTTSVGSFPPNAFGLHDMHGNVWEWCLDHWHDNYQGAPTDGSAWITGDSSDFRVCRGGSWLNLPRLCRSASRHHYDPCRTINICGFRVVCSTSRDLN